MRDYLYGLFLIVAEALQSVWKGTLIRRLLWVGISGVALKLVWDMVHLRDASVQFGLTSFFFIAAIPAVAWAGRHLVFASRDATELAGAKLSKAPRFTRVQPETVKGSRIRGHR